MASELTLETSKKRAKALKKNVTAACAEMRGIAELGRVVLTLGSVVPIIGTVCDVALSLMDKVIQYYDRAQDVLSVGEFLASQWRLLQRACESIKKVDELEDVKNFVATMRQLEPLLNELAKAVSEFENTNQFWNMLTVRATEKPMEALKTRIHDVVYELLETLKLAELDDIKRTVAESKNYHFQLESYIYSWVGKRTSARNNEAIKMAIEEIQGKGEDLEEMVSRGGIFSQKTIQFVFRRKLGEASYGLSQLHNLQRRLQRSTSDDSSDSDLGIDAEHGNALLRNEEHPSTYIGNPSAAASQGSWPDYFLKNFRSWLERQLDQLGTSSEIEASIDETELEAMANELKKCDAIVAEHNKHSNSRNIPYEELNAVRDARIVVLMAACAFYVPSVDDLLKEIGTDQVASILVLDMHKWKRHPIHYAALYNNRSAVQALLQREVDPNLLDWKADNAPLHYASKRGHAEVVGCLLSWKGIDVNWQNNDRYTPLMLAAYEGHTKIVMMLLESGAKPDFKSGDYDAFLLAKYNNHNFVAEYIEDHIKKNYSWYYHSRFNPELPSGKEPILHTLRKQRAGSTLASSTNTVSLNNFHGQFAGNAPSQLALIRENAHH